MKILTLALVFSSLLIDLSTSATEQEDDIMLIGNDTIYISSFPLEEIKMHFRPFGGKVERTNCWRGYRAVWRIDTDSLFLEKIYSCFSQSTEKQEEDIPELFRKNRLESKFVNGRVFADWYDANLGIPYYIGQRDTTRKTLWQTQPGSSNEYDVLTFSNGLLIDNRLSDYAALRRQNDEKLKRSMQKPSRHTAGYAGIWIPTGNLNILGSHPYLGFQLGMKVQKWVVSASINLKFLKAANYIHVRKDDSVYLTNHFFGGYAGVDFNYSLARKGRHQLDFIGGVGWDYLEVLKVSLGGKEEDLTQTVDGINLNAGVSYKYNFRSWNYIGLDIKYNYVDYHNPGGTDLSGHPITIGLVFGGWE